MSKPAPPDLGNKQERDELLAYAKRVKLQVEYDSPEYDLLNDTLPQMMAYIERLTEELEGRRRLMPALCGQCWTMSFAPCAETEEGAEADPNSEQGGFMQCQFCALQSRLRRQAEETTIVNRETGAPLVQTSNSRRPMDAGQL